MSSRDYTKQDLLDLAPEHDTFVGIDSDGCVFDTMGIKQKQCFHPRIISQWGLEAIEKPLREVAEFLNLYSKSRGKNRFICLLATMEMLRERADVTQAGVTVPDLPSLRRFIDSGIPLGNPTLQEEVDKTGDEELAAVLQWSLDVNRDVAKTIKKVPPFQWVIESLEKVKESSDAIVVSQTPAEALVREWEDNELTHFIKVIAGQELGKKSEHLQMATEGRYGPGKVLMIGDAPGDRKAAEANNACFYAINPGQEEASWERFYKEAYDKFLAEEFAGNYQQMVIDEFESLLPETPPWR